LDTYPVTANSVGRFLGTKGSKLERSYKDCLSDFRDWDQEGHAKEWVLFPNNMGTHLSIDETQLHDEVYTIVSNKAGHGKKGTIIAIVRGTKAEEKFKEWYKSVAQSTLREVKAARDLIMSREDEVLNYFSNRPTNAAAESLNAKMKGFRSQLRGISDLPFFMYRLGYFLARRSTGLCH